MRDSDYYKMDFDKFPRLDCKDDNPDKGFAVIDVPQACFGNTCGPVRDLRFMRTTVVMCVALALVGWGGNQVPIYGRKPHKVKPNQNGKKFPRVLLAHIDDWGLEDGQHDICQPSRTQALINMCKELSNLHAYVVNGDLEPPLLGRILQDLELRGIPFELQTGYHTGDLAIDLVDGKPINPNALNGSAEYKPNKNLENAFFGQVFSRVSILAGAFNLEEGIPQGFYRVGPEAPKEELAPILGDSDFENAAASISAKCKAAETETILLPSRARKKNIQEKSKQSSIRWAKEQKFTMAQIPVLPSAEIFRIPRRPYPT